MAIPVYDDLVHYATPPTNYIGATFFLSYIVFALYATIRTVYSLYSQYNAIYHPATTSKKPTPDANFKAARDARARHIKIYAFLASISFATLSYHMLFFLITHYLQWSGDKSLSAVNAEKLKRWMLQSKLFQDFAVELVKTPQNAVWTQAAILGTWFWGIWVAQKAQSHKIPSQTMQTYLLLSQILPISFTVSLFTITLHLSSPNIQPASSTPAAPPTRTRRPLASLLLPTILLNACLLSQPSLRTTQAFSALLFLERAILLLPHTGIVSLKDSDVVKCITISGAFVSTAWYMVRKELVVWRVGEALVSGGFAVRALGWDAIIGVVVAGVLGWGGGV